MRGGLKQTGVLHVIDTYDVRLAAESGSSPAPSAGIARGEVEADARAALT